MIEQRPLQPFRVQLQRLQGEKRLRVQGGKDVGGRTLRVEALPDVARPFHLYLRTAEPVRSKVQAQIVEPVPKLSPRRDTQLGHGLQHVFGMNF